MLGTGPLGWDLPSGWGQGKGTFFQRGEALTDFKARPRALGAIANTSLGLVPRPMPLVILTVQRAQLLNPCCTLQTLPWAPTSPWVSALLYLLALISQPPPISALRLCIQLLGP